MSNRRTDIIDKCPEEFIGELESFIDDLESGMSQVVALLEINSLDELDSIIEACNELTSLKDSLY